jgi:hypothetical protein
VRRAAFAAAALLFVAGPAAADTACKATKAAYDALKTGMSIAAAEAVIGCAGEEISSSEMAGYKTVMLMWSGNSFGGNMNAMFQNDEMITKAQFGLK